MKNIQIEVRDSKAVITIDLKAEQGASKTGKSLVIGTTEGNVTIPGTDIKLGVNCYRPRA